MIVPLLVIQTGSNAQTTYDWIDPAGGVFQDAGNWSPGGGPPGNMDTARFNQSGSYPVSFNASRTNQFLHVGKDEVNLDLGGHTYTLTGGFPTVVLGVNPGDANLLTVENGTLLTDSAALALSWPNSQAELFLFGATTWQNSAAIYIGGAGTASVQASGGADVTCLWTEVGAFGGGDGELEVLDAGTTWTCAGSVMAVGSSSDGTLIVNGGGVVTSAWGEIASQTGTTGITTIFGAGSRWDMPGSVTAVGLRGIGIMSIVSGGVVTSGYAEIGGMAGAYGSVGVSGAGSRWDVGSHILVGTNSMGVLDIQAGGTVTAQRMILGRHVGSSGELTVNGTLDIEADGTYLYVGYDGPGEATINGSLTVTDPGGTIGGDDGYVNVGAFAGAPGLLTINSGGSLSCSAQLQLGSLAGAHGEVVINTGGTAISRLAASSPSGAAGNVARDGTGIMTIAGGLWNCLDGALNVGFNNGSNGTMTITSGGEALSIGGSIGRSAGANGTVEIDGAGSNWTSSATLNVGVGGTGSLSVLGGGLAEAPQIVIGANGTAGGTGMLTADVSNSGVVRPGDRPGPSDVGTLTIDGNYTQESGGRLIVDVGGTGAGQFDLLNASGIIDLGGTLQINLVSGFQPVGGEQIVIIANGSVLNNFDTIISPMCVTVTPQATQVVLTFCATGDVNCDDAIDGTDIVDFVAAVLSGQVSCGADLNGDGRVDGLDVQPFVNAVL